MSSNLGKYTVLLCFVLLSSSVACQSSYTHALPAYHESSSRNFRFGEHGLVLSAANSMSADESPRIVSRLFDSDGVLLETNLLSIENSPLFPGYPGTALQLNDSLFAWVYSSGGPVLLLFSHDFSFFEQHSIQSQNDYPEFFVVDHLIHTNDELTLFGQQTTSGQTHAFMGTYDLNENSDVIIEDDLLETFLLERIRSAYQIGEDYFASGYYLHLNSNDDVVSSPFCAKLNVDGSTIWEDSFGSSELNQGPAIIEHNPGENTVEAFYPKSINQLSSAPWAVEGPIARRSYTPDGTFVSEVELGSSLLVPTVNDVLRTEEHTYVLGTHIHLESDNRLSCLLKLNAAGELVWFQNIIPEFCDDCDGELQNIQPLGDGFIASGRKRTFTDDGAIVDSTWVTVLDCFGHVTPPSLTDCLVYTVSDDGVLQASLGSAAFNNPIWTVDGNTFTGSELNTSFDESGTYTVDLQVDYCATSLTASFEVDVMVSVEEKVFDAARISPNPSAGLIQLTGLPRNTTVNIYDLRGKHVATLNPLGSSAQVQAAPGVYLLVLQQGKAALRMKAVVN